MPIRPENAGRYPADWRLISFGIRFGRGEGRCECTGECGRERCRPRCDAEHGKPHPVSGSVVVLTTAHLADPIEDCRPENLRGMCQACHLRYDMPRHQAVQRQNREAKRRRILDKAGQLAFEVECFGPVGSPAATAPRSGHRDRRAGHKNNP